MTEEKKMKIEFAPGCFDSFEGTQEELDALINEINTMFATMTPEELMARSRPLDIDELIEEDEEVAEKLISAIDEQKRKLQ